jgi:hypothetical protein
MTEYEYLTKYQINENWIRTRYRRSKKKHVTPALETKENGGIIRNNLTEETNDYQRLDSDKVLGYTSYYEMQRARHPKKKKRRRY